MSLINGIGGVFIFSNNPQRLAQWYAESFGLKYEESAETSDFYLIFYGLDPENPARKLDTVFAILEARVPLPGSAPEVEPESMYGDQPYMLNLRTPDLEALLEHLQEKGVAVIRREDLSYGKFAWVRDPDGNRLELYQPLQIPGGEEIE